MIFRFKRNKINSLAPLFFVNSYASIALQYLATLFCASFPQMSFTFRDFIKNYRIAVLSFIIVLLNTVIFYLLVRQSTSESKKRIFVSECSHITHRIEKRLNFYILLLQSANSYFATSDTVTKKSWSKFVSHLNIEKEIPGIQGIGYSIVVPLEKRKSHEEEMRRKGYSEYKIRPEGLRDIYTSILYLEPENWRNKRAIGFDMFSEPARREAMLRARDQNTAGITGKVILIQEAAQDVQPGFLIYTPVYQKGEYPRTLKERQTGLKGFVYSAFRSGDLIASIFKGESYGISFQIYDLGTITPDNLLYSSDPDFSLASSSIVHTDKIFLAGRFWTIVFAPKPDMGTFSENNLATIVLVGGILISILIFALACYISKSRRDEEESKEQLAKQNKELKKTNTDLDNFIYTASHDLKAPIANIEGLVLQLPDLLPESQTSEELGGVLDMIHQSISKFKTTIDDLTDISKIQRSFEDSESTLEIEEVIKDVLADIYPLVERSKATFDIDTRECRIITFSRKT